MIIKDWCTYIFYPMAPWLFFLLSGVFGGLICVKKLRDIHNTMGTVTIFAMFFFFLSLLLEVIRG